MIILLINLGCYKIQWAAQEVAMSLRVGAENVGQKSFGKKIIGQKKLKVQQFLVKKGDNGVKKEMTNYVFYSVFMLDGDEGRGHEISHFLSNWKYIQGLYTYCVIT